MKFGTPRSLLQFRPIELDGRKRRFARGASRAALPT